MAAEKKRLPPAKFYKIASDKKLRLAGELLSVRHPITETARTLPDSEIFHKRFFRKIINNVYGLSVAAKNGFL